MHGTQVLQPQLHTFSQVAGNSFRDQALVPDESRGSAAARRSRAARRPSLSKSPSSTIHYHRSAQSTSLIELDPKPVIRPDPSTITTPTIVVHSAQREDYFALADVGNNDTTSIPTTAGNTNPTTTTTPTTKVSYDGKKRADGIDKPGRRASRGSMPVASSSMANMASMASTLPPRPPLVSHTSNSVPTTPYQQAREFPSRSPSPPQHLTGSHSPRSVKSEANGYMAALPRGRPTCKYETAAAFGRRRVQYDIGDAILETPAADPKPSLDPDEEDKLSGDMRELYDRLLPSKESEQRRRDLVVKLDRILRKEWPGNDFTVHVFGSSGNMLCTSESDVDICVQTPMKKLETMHTLAEAMANNGMERVICIASAKVPIVKIWDPKLKLACDINVNNTLALENTRMIQTYVQIDERVRPLAMIIKHWTRQRVLNDAGLGGTLSSYTWICMILNFLQTRSPPILPALHQRSHEPYIASDGSESGFSDDLEQVRDFGRGNKESLAQLLFHFFRRYGYEINYEQDVVSVRHGKLMSRKEKGWDQAKEAQWRLCVEEPFNTTRNLGNTADATAFRGIHLEIRQAFEYLADGVQLAKCCEQFEFPPEEKVVFKKPTPTHKPAILREPPNARSGRGISATVRGPSSRNSPSFRSPQGNRRSSSGANYRPNHYGYAPALNLAGLETPEQLQQQLQQQYLLNANRLIALKAQLNSLSPSAHPHGAASILAQAEADTAHAQARLGLATAAASPQRPTFINGTTPTVLGEDGRIYPAYPAVYGYPQRHPFELTQPMSHTSSQDGSRTHPASPSLSSAVPVPRRSVQRSMAPNGTQASSIRSQSQPARAIPGHMLPHPSSGYAIPPVPMYDSSMYSQLPPQVSGLELAQGYSDLPLRTSQTASVAETGSGTASPREYLGYYLDEAPQMHQPPPSRKQTFHLPPIPPFGEMKRQRAAAATDLMPVPSSIYTRRASRSPSPLGHVRSFSTASGLRSAPLPSMHLGQLPRQRQEPSPLPYTGGPIIANGSSYASTASPPTGESLATPDEIRMDAAELVPESFASTVTGPPHVQSAYDVFGIQPSLDEGLYSHPSEDDPLIATASHVNSILADPPKPKPKPNGMVVVSSSQSQPPLPSATEPFPPLPQTSPDHSMSQTTYHTSSSTSSPPEASTPQTKSPWRTVAAAKSPVPPLDLSKVSNNPSNGSGGASGTSDAIVPKPLPSSGAAPLLSPVIETRTPSPTASRSGRNTATPVSARANGSAVGPLVANGTYADAGRRADSVFSPAIAHSYTANGALASLTNTSREDSSVLKQARQLDSKAASFAIGDKAGTSIQSASSPVTTTAPSHHQSQSSQSKIQQPSGQWESTSSMKGKKKRGRTKSGTIKGGPVPGEGEAMPANEAERKGG